MPTSRHAVRFLASLFVAAVCACGGASEHPAGTPPVEAPLPEGARPPIADAGGPVADAGAEPPADAGVPDAGPPSPTLTGVGSGAVSGYVALKATVASDTTRVDFQLDGTTFATASAAPFSTAWNSFDAQNGPHRLSFNATGAGGALTASAPLQVTVGNHIKNVFVIVMENTDWSSVKGSSSAPYINGTLLARGAHAERYMNVPGLHPSLPNYLWLESGSDQGVSDDAAPANHRLTGQHLVGLLNAAHLSWKAYQEDISGTSCPLNSVSLYAPKHNPMVYFDDVNGRVDSANAYCIAHVRPYTELINDLEANQVPSYSFITPNQCNDMHNSDCGIGAGDAWLSQEIPKIMASKAYREGGAIFVVWDESDSGNVPIGFIALSPMAKPGYSSQVSYTHGSTLRSLQEIFNVTPLLGAAATSTDLADLFKTFP